MREHKSNNTITLGEKIKLFRKRNAMSQLQIELLAGLGPGALSRIERDITNPQKETVMKIANSLKLTPEETAYLFGIDINKTR